MSLKKMEIEILWFLSKVSLSQISCKLTVIWLKKVKAFVMTLRVQFLKMKFVRNAPMIYNNLIKNVTTK